MFLSRRRFVQLWERRSAPRLPVVFYFVKDHGEQLRCFTGAVKTVRRSRAFVGHSSVYGVLKSTDLVPGDNRAGLTQKPAARGGRFTRSRILDRMARVPLMPEVAPTFSDEPAAAEPMVAASASTGEPSAML